MSSLIADWSPEKERETEWKILKGLGCFLKNSQIQLQASPHHQHVSMNPKSFHKALGEHRYGGTKTEARELPSGCRAELTPITVLFSSTQTHTKDGRGGKGGQLKPSSRFRRPPVAAPHSPAHRCCRRSSGCWARSPPPAGCTAQPALL